MEDQRKLSTRYTMTLFGLVLFISIMYMGMVVIERETTMLEDHITKRNLSYIVDKEYKVEKIEEKPESI